jgi:hypothetical protein
MWPNSVPSHFKGAPKRSAVAAIFLNFLFKRISLQGTVLTKSNYVTPISSVIKCRHVRTGPGSRKKLDSRVVEERGGKNRDVSRLEDRRMPDLKVERIHLLGYKCSNYTPTALQRHNIENSKQMPQKDCATTAPISKFMGLWAIYIFPRSIRLFCCWKICGPILGIYKSLTDT